MIRTLKRKFIKAAMTAVTVLLLSLLGALNLVNAWSTRQESLRLLDNLIRMDRTVRSPPMGSGFPCSRRENGRFAARESASVGL